VSKLGGKLIRAAKEARSSVRGKAKASTYRIHLQDDIDVQSIRKRLRLSQAEFSARFGIPSGTLRDWEQGRRVPEGPARILLKVIEKDPKAVERALAAA
jgi:putative transcriptional regulator